MHTQAETHAQIARMHKHTHTVVSFGPCPASNTHLLAKGRIVTHTLGPLGSIEGYKDIYCSHDLHTQVWSTTLQYNYSFRLAT